MSIKLDIKKLSGWGIPITDKFIIAGPCSAESETQLMQTALGLKGYPVSVLRAGVWKPRTRPNSFEGVGSRGLKWLKEAGTAVNLPVTVEVANPHHIEACLDHGIDILWIGARTTPNPFAMQEISAALAGVDIPVMVKNPINSDLHLWIGALERLNLKGMTKLMAIHRGFSSYKNELYRNQPLWRIPLELKRLIPDIPLICDPSHICGKSELIPRVAQKAMDLLYDGLMIEVHHNPGQALSDAGQQLTPAEFGNLLKNLKYKNVLTDSPDYITHINSLREEIDRCDSQIIEIFTRRMKNSREIAMHKMKNNISIFQPDRWNEIVENRIKEGLSHNLSENFIHQVFQCIHEESIRQQEQTLCD